MGNIFVGSSLYDYDVLEADFNTNANKIDSTLLWFVPGIVTPEQYKKEKDNFAKESLTVAATSGSVDLLLPNNVHQQPASPPNGCAPTSGAMVMEYWRGSHGCINLPTWQTDFNELRWTPSVGQDNGFIKRESCHSYSVC